jgi:cell wall assembly regulator SMI1
MSEMLQKLFAEIEQYHDSEPCQNPSEIDGVEEKYGYKLPADLKAFYRRYRYVGLFKQEWSEYRWYTYRFVAVSEIHSTRIDIFGEDLDEYGPATWLTICDVQDGNYIAIDITSEKDGRFNYIDCFHETFAEPGHSKVVAQSFIELLERALHGGDEQFFFLQQGFSGYGDALAG